MFHNYIPKDSMNKLLLVIALVLPMSFAHADWTDTPLTEPGIGCMVLGGAAYMSGQSTSNSMIACIAGAAAGYVLEKHYTNKAADKYSRDNQILKAQLDEIVHQRAINNSLGYGKMNNLVIKETIVPAKTLPDGSIQLETIRLKATLPGQDLILGD